MAQTPRQNPKCIGNVDYDGHIGNAVERDPRRLLARIAACSCITPYLDVLTSPELFVA